MSSHSLFAQLNKYFRSVHFWLKLTTGFLSFPLLIHQQKQQKLGDKMDLWSYLLKPVQRISKYSLLLQDMMRECGPGQTREMAEVKAALEVIHFQLRHGNNLLAMDAIQQCDVRGFVFSTFGSLCQTL